MIYIQSFFEWVIMLASDVFPGAGTERTHSIPKRSLYLRIVDAVEDSVESAQNMLR